MKKVTGLLTILFSVFLNCFLFGQLDSIFITCDSILFQQMYNNYLEDDYIDCRVKYLEAEYPSQIRIRGSSSREYPKKSLKIKHRSPNGTRIINLNADYLDQSYMHQYLSSNLYKMMNQVSFSCSHKVVFLNDDFLGIYLQVENIDDDFLLKNKLSPYGNLYKASKDYANMSLYDDPDYYWEKKSNKKNNNEDLKNLINTINTIPGFAFTDYIKTSFNYDNLISSVALNMLIGNGSTYYHNYYLYHNTLETNKWYYLPWDLDKTMGSYNKYLRYDYCSWSSTQSGAMPENPLVKKLFLNPRTFSDIQNKINDLTASIFNAKKLYPIIDSLETILEPYINQDTLDQINAINQWKKEIKKIKKYIINRPLQLRHQIKHTPTPFLMYNNYNQQFKDTIRLRWSSSFVGEKTCDNYILKISRSKLFDDEDTFVFKNIKDTFFTYSLPKGQYYWHINAIHENQKTNGYNSRSFFIVGEAYYLDGPIKEKMIIKNRNVVIAEDLTIEKSGELIITGNSEIHIHPNKQILNFGTLKIIGSQDDKIPIRCQDEQSFWLGIYSEGLIDIQHAHFSQAKGKSIIRQIGGEAKMTQCKSAYNLVRESVSFNHCPVKIHNNHFNHSSGEGILLLNCSGTVSSNVLIGIKDAIEATRCNKMDIFNNFVSDSKDDGIDINFGSQISVYNNTIINATDKGISLTLDSMFKHNEIRNNLILANTRGIGLEGSGQIILSENIYINNSIPIFIENPDKINIKSHNEIINTKYTNTHVDFNNTQTKLSYKLTLQQENDEISIKSNTLFPIDLNGLKILVGNDLVFKCTERLLLFPNKTITLTKIDTITQNNLKARMITDELNTNELNYINQTVKKLTKKELAIYILLLLLLIIIIISVKNNVLKI